MIALFAKRFWRRCSLSPGQRKTVYGREEEPYDRCHSGQVESFARDCRKGAGGRQERQGEDIARARREGATDLEIHDRVLIAAAFCMYNRYVDGLAAWTPTDAVRFRERAAGVAREGYLGVLSYIGSAVKAPDAPVT